MAVVLDGSREEIARFGGGDSNVFESRLFATAEHHGKRARLRIVDRARGSWGHINFAGVYPGTELWRK